MNRNFIAWNTSLILLLIIAIACAPSAETLKKRETAITARSLGERYMLEGDYPKAIKELSRAEKLNPKDPMTQNYLGLSFRASAQKTRNPSSQNQFLELALKHYKKALTLDPDFSIARNNLGNVYMDLGRLDEAIASYKEVTKDLTYDTPFYPLSNLGWAYSNKGEYETAEKYYLDALKLEPRFLLAMLGLGRTYVAMGKMADAVGVLEKAAEVYPQTPEVYLDLGDAYKAARNKTKALEAYRKVINLAPNTLLAYRANNKIREINQ